MLTDIRVTDGKRVRKVRLYPRNAGFDGVNAGAYLPYSLDKIHGHDAESAITRFLDYAQQGGWRVIPYGRPCNG